MTLPRSHHLGTLADALDAQAKALSAVAVALREGGAAPAAESKFYDQYTSPLSKRVFLAHAREQAFPTWRIGKRVLVERAVFERWLSQQPANAKRLAPTTANAHRDLEAEALAELGMRRKGGAR
jgi:hypothetical protein